MDVDGIINQYLRLIEDDLRSVVPSVEEATGTLGTFYTMLRYHLGWIDQSSEIAGSEGGKRLRPILCLLACEAAGGDHRLALPVASAVELLHNFTLIHDDIQDRSYERRHRPTVWRIWGEAQAINAGDAMYSLALLALRRLPEIGVDASYIVTAVSELNQTLLVLAEGQYLDISFEQTMDVSLGDYQAMIERKTAALMGSALWLGAYLASNDTEMSEHYRMFGRGLGVAFQIQDDILGIWGDPKETGKTAGDDILRKKKTLPLLFALGAAQDEHRNRLIEIYRSSNVSKATIKEVKEILARVGAREYAEEKAREWYENSLRHLEAAKPEQEAGQRLRMLASALLNRSR